MRLYIDSLWLSPYTYTVFSALREKAIPFELVEVEFAANRSLTPGYRDRSPTDLIPLLEDGDFRLVESLAILEYLEDRFAAPAYRALYPVDLRARAEARMLLSWYRCGLSRLRDERSTETVYYPNAPRSALSDAVRDEVADWLPVISERLARAGGEYLFGTWCIADTETALMLQRLIASGDEVPEPLRSYARHVWDRPACREWVAHPRGQFRSYYN